MIKSDTPNELRKETLLLRNYFNHRNVKYRNENGIEDDTAILQRLRRVINVRDDQGMTPVHVCCYSIVTLCEENATKKNVNIRLLYLLEEFGGEFDASDNLGITPVDIIQRHLIRMCIIENNTRSLSCSCVVSSSLRQSWFSSTIKMTLNEMKSLKYKVGSKEKVIFDVKNKFQSYVEYCLKSFSCFISFYSRAQLRLKCHNPDEPLINFSAEYYYLQEFNNLHYRYHKHFNPFLRLMKTLELMVLKHVFKLRMRQLFMYKLPIEVIDMVSRSYNYSVVDMLSICDNYADVNRIINKHTFSIWNDEILRRDIDICQLVFRNEYLTNDVNTNNKQTYVKRYVNILRRNVRYKPYV